MKRYTVCLSLDRNFCETTTKEMAERHNAVGYEITIIPPTWRYKTAYRGEIILQEDKQ